MYVYIYIYIYIYACDAGATTRRRPLRQTSRPALHPAQLRGRWSIYGYYYYYYYYYLIIMIMIIIMKINIYGVWLCPVSVACGGATFEAQLDGAALHPEIWKA